MTIRIGKIVNPYWLVKFDIHGWTTADSPRTLGGTVYSPLSPIREIFGLGAMGTRISSEPFGIRLADPQFAWRNAYRDSYYNREILFMFVPRFGAEPQHVLAGWCWMRTTAATDQGAMTEFSFKNRLARLENTRIRTPTVDSQRKAGHPADTGPELAQTTISVTWGGSPRTGG